MGSYLMNGTILAQSVFFFSMFYVLSIVFTVSCSDWFLVWVGLEINMMSFIILVYDRSSGSIEACLKYFFVQSLGSGILMMMFYSNFEWFDFVSVMILSYKMGGGPFYFWFPSICESLGWGGCLLLMTVQKILPLLLISFLMSVILWLVIISSMILGGLGSLNQKSVKRLMAYSSIHHIGWILLGNFFSNNIWVVYLVLYSLMMSGIVWGLSKDKILEIGMLKKVSSKWTFVLGMLSISGMPPMLGFYLKWWLFYNVMMMDMSVLILMILLSVLMFYVYLRISYMILMGGSMMNSWNLMFLNKKMMSVDLIYILGVNIGVSIWMLM